MNTEKRKKDLMDIISTVLKDGVLQYKDGQVLNGKLAFAHGQIFGLSAKYVLQSVYDHIYAKPFRAKISDELTNALQIFSRQIGCQPSQDDQHGDQTY